MVMIPPLPLSSPRKDWAAHFPIRNLEVYSAYPLLINPTHYVGDQGWFSDTEPPKEVLEEIRQRKIRQEKEEAAKKMEKAVESHQVKVKEESLKRQIEAMREKLKPKTEL